MKTSKTIGSDTQDYKMGYMNDESGDWEELTDENRKEVAEQLGCNPKFLEFIEDNIRGLVETIHMDLVEIWKKIED